MIELRYARCITLSVSGKGNKVFRVEDEEPFSEDQVNNFDELVRSKAIKIVKPKAKRGRRLNTDSSAEGSDSDHSSSEENND